MIKVIERKDDGWWIGSINERTGIFPSNYVVSNDEINESSDTKNSTDNEMTNSKNPCNVFVNKKVNINNFSYLPPGGLNADNTPILKSSKKEINNNDNNNSQPSNNNQIDCSICDCKEFKCNIFKPLSCINCFHKH